MKKSVLIFIFLLILLPILIYVVGQRVNWRPKAGGGIDPRAYNPTTLTFPIYSMGGNPGELDLSDKGFHPDWAMQDNSVTTLQNISSDTADVSANSYGLDGSIICSKNFSIPPFGQKEVDFKRESCWSGISNSYSTLVVEANKGVRGVYNLTKIGTDSFISDSYEGYLSSQKAKKWYFPLYLEGKGKNQDDYLRTNIFVFNPDPQRTAVYKVYYYKENGEFGGGTGAAELNPLSSSYMYQLSTGYGSIVVEANADIFAQAMTVSSKRAYFVKGQSEVKNEWLMPFPFNKTNDCKAKYREDYPYCGEAKLLVFNAGNQTTNIVVVGLTQSNGDIINNIIDQKINLEPNGTAVFGLRDYTIYKALSTAGSISASVIYQNDQYWDSAYMTANPAHFQFIPIWEMNKSPFKTTSLIKVFNPHEYEISADVDFFDNFGQKKFSLEKVVMPFGAENFYGDSQQNIGAFGSAWVRGYKIGDKGPAGETDVFAVVVGSQEARDSRGALFAGDGAFIYQGAGLEGEVPIPSGAPRSYYEPGWNRLLNYNGGRPLIECPIGSEKRENYWNTWNNILTTPYPVNPSGNPEVRFPDYLRCVMPLPLERR